MNILVTGSKGMVGTALVNNLKNIRDGKNKTTNLIWYVVGSEQRDLSLVNEKINEI